LVRVEAIVNELKNQEESLRFQVEQAEKYLNAKARLERLQQCSAATRWYRLQQETTAVRKTQQATLQSLQDLSASRAVWETRKSALLLETAQREAQSQDLQLTRQQCKEEIIKLEGRLETESAAIDHLDEWHQKGEAETELLQKQIQTIEYQIQLQTQETEYLKAESRRKSERINELQEAEKIKHRQLSDQQRDMERCQIVETELKTRLSSDQQQLLQLRERMGDTATRAAALKKQLIELSGEETTTTARLNELLLALENARQKKETIRDRVQTLQQEKEQQELQRERLAGVIQALSLKLQQADGRYQTLRELMQRHEGYDSATKKFLDHLAEQPVLSADLGFIGTLAELVDPPESSLPQPTAFLNRYFNLLVFKSFLKLEPIIALVETLAIEQVQLYFLDLMASNAKESTAVASQWIRSRAELSSTVPLAGDFRTIDQPLSRLSRETLLAGEGLIDPAAVIMTRAKIFLVGKPGSSNQAELYFTRQRELQVLERDRPELVAKLQAAEEALVGAEERGDEVTKTLERDRQDLIRLDLELVRLEQEQAAQNKAKTRVQLMLENLKTEQGQAEAALALFKDKIAELDHLILSHQKRQREMQDSLGRLRSVIEATTSDRRVNIDELQLLKISLAALEEKQKNNTATLNRLEEDLNQRRQQLQEIRKHAEETKGKREWYTTSIRKAKASLPGLLDRLQQIETQIQQLAGRLDTDRMERQDYEARIQKDAKRIESLTEKNHKLEVQLAQLVQEAKNIADNMFAESGVHPEELIQTFDVHSFDLEQEAETVLQLKQAVGRMDNVNLAAKREYDVLKERLDFLSSQSSDLIQSLNALESSISRINQESRRRFRETFTAVNEQFSRLFPQLFGGGEAHLELTDESDLLEAGVEIIAKPPGKKLQNMNLLSGGEKALTAIALVFGVFQIKPSPFCLLDEVDAPLDDANNGRFSQHVKMLTEHSQFIIITHNKKTMEIGDALFGVTMEEPGISKIVSVDFSRIPLET